MLIRHRRLQRMIGPYVDGEIRGPVRARVAAHLGSCARCSEEATFITRLKRSLRRIGGGER